MTCFDGIAEAENDAELRAWLDKVLDLKSELATFTASRRKGGRPVEIVGYLHGSFNFGIHIKFDDDGSDALIRFPKPGRTRFRDEKVVNEVRVMTFISQNTTIPLPKIIDWGLSSEGPHGLGPFIIMEYVEGTNLGSFFKQPTKTEQDEAKLDPNIEDATLEKIYEQIAGFMIQLSQLDFDRIGSITNDNDSPDKWSVTGRPFTYNMNELVTVAYFPIDKFPTGPFMSAREYFEYVAEEHLIHVHTQRNLADDPDNAGGRYVARHRFKALIPKYCKYDTGPFKLFCDDLQLTNMLINKETLEITAVLDWEFTNVFPAQFSYDPPWWLLLNGPDMWLEKRSMESFIESYEPKLHLFLRAMEKAETEAEARKELSSRPRLSILMRESWESGQFWFDYAARKSFDIDEVYWAILHGSDSDALPEDTRRGLQPFIDMKMKQLEAYNKEYGERLKE